MTIKTSIDSSRYPYYVNSKPSMGRLVLSIWKKGCEDDMDLGPSRQEMSFRYVLSVLNHPPCRLNKSLGCLVLLPPSRRISW